MIPKMALKEPSDEQKAIVGAICSGIPLVIVDAVAGSGKTTTICHVARALKKARILVLTYNARLKQETRKRLQELNLVNAEAHSYNAAGVKYYRESCKTNDGIWDVIFENQSPSKPLGGFDVIICDEVQDMTPIDRMGRRWAQ